MISVEEAKAIVLDNLFPLTEKLDLKVADALGFRLAETILSPLNLPPFDQSNVDGYAVRFTDDNNKEWKVIQEIKAGDSTSIKLQKGEAVRVFTGAMVPLGTNAVVMQEKITVKKDLIFCVDNFIPELGDNVRTEGAEIKKGDIALYANVIINPAVIAFISALGIANVSVFRKPKIGLIITGNELQQPGKVLQKGQVYESNSATLTAALKSIGLNVSELIFVKDDKKSVYDAVGKIKDQVDVLLLSGGISVGDYDFVNEVLEEHGTTTLFYKVAQKPGKPLLFGKNEKTLVFALPGNPASALTCFYEYVLPALQKMQGKSNCFLNTVHLPITKNVTKKNGLAFFLKAKINSNGVEPLIGQQSFITKSFAEADAFIYLPKEKENPAIGEIVEVHVIPQI